jgi:hypothetical protein
MSYNVKLTISMNSRPDIIRKLWSMRKKFGTSFKEKCVLSSSPHGLAHFNHS